MRGGLTGTQVERDEENQTETPWMVTPSLLRHPSLFYFSVNNVLYSVLSGWHGESRRK